MLEKIYLKQLGIEALELYLKTTNIHKIQSLVYDNKDLFSLFKIFNQILNNKKIIPEDENLQNLINECKIKLNQ